MLICQISDLHICPSGQKLYGFIDTNALCARHVAYINNLPEKPDALVVTGDITNCGTPDEYEMAASILGQADMPLFLIPGNHDCKENFLSGLGRLTPLLGEDPEAMAYTVEDFPVRLIFLDSSRAGSLSGFIPARTLDWLEKELSGQRERDTVLFLHHHPVPSGCLHMDNIRCQNGDQLLTLIKAFPKVTRVFCGHTHRAIVQAFGTMVIITAPSACHQVPFDTRDPNGFYSLEPPAMLMHRYSPETGLVTFQASLAPFDGPFRFDTTLACPDAPWA